MNRQMPRYAWVVVGLLVVSAIINFIDRGSLSVAAPSLSIDLGLSPSQTGIVLSAFFWTYSVFQLVFGWLIDRYSVRKVFAAAFFFLFLFKPLGPLPGGSFFVFFWRVLVATREASCWVSTFVDFISRAAH